MRDVHVFMCVCVYVMCMCVCVCARAYIPGPLKGSGAGGTA